MQKTEEFVYCLELTKNHIIQDKKNVPKMITEKS